LNGEYRQPQAVGKGASFASGESAEVKPQIMINDPMRVAVTSRYSDGLRAGRPKEFESRQGQDFSSLHSVQTGSGARPASYPTGIGGSFPGGKAAGA
jgi:hypothetical protein